VEGQRSRFDSAYRWFLEGWPADVEPTPAEREAFFGELRARGTRDLTMVVGALMFFDLGYLPTDPWAFAAVPRLVPILRDGRLALALLGLVAMVAVRVLPRHPYPIGVIGSTTALGVFGWTLARCGPPSEPWLYFSLPFFFGAGAAWLRPVSRAGVLVLLGAALVAGYFGTHPAHLADPLTRVALAHLAYILAAAWIAGCWFDTFRVRLFFATARLAEERAALAERVAEQTRSLRALVQRSESIREAERAAIARDLHDDLGQTLTAARLILKHARSRPDPAAIGANLDMLSGSLDELNAQTRRILHDLRPTLLDKEGLETAVAALIARTEESSGLQVTYEPTPIRVPEGVAIVAWRCVQEALTNIARHAEARRASVRLTLRDDALVISVEDDGRGFNPSRRASGLGLLGIHERASIIGGTAHIDSAPGRGTRVEVRLPLPEEP
jgi:signal transduction histidine kinase